MYRYTTPTIPITIADIDFTTVATFRIMFKRGSKSMLFEIDADDTRVDATNNTITLTLTQEETASFSEGHIEVQVRIIYSSGVVQATSKAKLAVNGVFDEVIV